MNKTAPLVSLVLAVCGLTACKQETKSDPVALGRHIVHDVAMCVDCHTPHLPDGSLDEDKMLAGSMLPFAATVPMPWGANAPGIAGLPTYADDAAAVKFLTTGQTNHGTPPRPPMPGYRLSETEARAVVAYLRTLKRADS